LELLMTVSTVRLGAVLCAGLITLGTPALAQAPSPEAAEIASCMCLKRTVDDLNADMAAKKRALDEAAAKLADLDARLDAERARVDVNDPQGVARFRQMLEQRDVVFRQVTGAVGEAARSAVERYNARVGEYNNRCTNRPFNADLSRQVAATLVCPMGN